MEVETSSLGPSTFDGLSESSYDLHDHDSRSETSSFDETSNDEREGAHYDENGMEAEDAETPSISFVGGSYDLTSSKLGSSVDTIQQGLNSTSSSQVRLVFPDPGLSFSSQIISEADRTTFGSSRCLRSRAETTTEIGKVENLQAERRSSSPIRFSNEAWERSSKLWAPEGFSTADYQLLQSTESFEKLKESCKEQIADESVSVKEEESMVESAEETEADATVVQDPKEGISSGTLLPSQRAQPTRWSGRVSMLAFLGLMSAISVALFNTYGFKALPTFRQANSTLSNPLPAASNAAANPSQSMWDPLSLSHLFTSSYSRTPYQPASTGSISGVADLKLVKQALSTLHTVQSRAHNALHASTTGSNRAGRKQKKTEDEHARTSPVAVAVRDRDTSLSVRASKALVMTSGPISQASKWTRKLMGANHTEFKMCKERARAGNCTCDLSTYYLTQVYPQIIRSYTQSKTMAVATVTRISQFVLQEFRELQLFASHFGQTIQAACSLMFSRATRGAQILKSSLQPLYQRVTASHRRDSYTTTTTTKVVKTKETLDQLAEYVETRFDGLSEMIDRQAGDLQRQAGQSIRKAKKGLNRLIRDAHSDSQPKRQIRKEKMKRRAVNSEKNGRLCFKSRKATWGKSGRRR